MLTYLHDKTPHILRSAFAFSRAYHSYTHSLSLLTGKPKIRQPNALDSMAKKKGAPEFQKRKAFSPGLCKNVAPTFSGRQEGGGNQDGTCDVFRDGMKV